MLLTEEKVCQLIDLAREYADSHNLVADEYINGLINPDTIGDADSGQVIETLIKYHLDWLKK